MRTTTIILSLLLAATHTLAQPRGSASVQAADSTYSYDLRRFSVETSQFADTVPLLWSGQKAYLPVIVNGQKFLFLLDTGASMSILYKEATRRRSHSLTDALTPAGSIRMLDALGQAATVDVVLAERLVVGNNDSSPSRLTLSNYPLCLMSRPAGTVHCDGVLGFDFINKGLLAKIDTRQAQLIVSDQPKRFASEAGYTLKYRLQHHVPYLQLWPFAHMDELMAFDTGCSYMCLLNSKHFADYERLRPNEVAAQTYDSDSSQVLIGTLSADTTHTPTHLRLQSLRWQRYSITDVTAQTTRWRSRVGAPILEHHAVVIDGRRRRIVLQPYK